MSAASRSSSHPRFIVAAWLFWWGDVLLGLVPTTWLERSHLFLPRIWLTPEREGMRVARQAAPGLPPTELGSVSFDQPPRALLGRNTRAKPRWLLAIPASAAIIKELSLPAAVRSRLDEVLRFELDRHTPFNAETALFGYEELPSAVPGAVNVRLVAVPRRRFQEWLEALARHAVVPEHSVVRLDAEGAAAVPLQWDPSGAARPYRPALAALAVTAVLVIAILLVPLVVKREVVLDHQHRHAAILPQAQAVAAVDREREALLERLRYPLQQRQSRRPVTDILKDLTETLSDEGYLYTLRIEGGDLRIDGETATATTLIEPLEALSSLTEVRFLSPTSRVQGQRERFQIGARITPPLEAAP